MALAEHDSSVGRRPGLAIKNHAGPRPGV
jgi:hypothetical protein